MDRLCCENVSKSFNAHVALDDVSFDVSAGACLGVVGPSGAGKSTLLHLLAGLERVDGGCIRFDADIVSSPAVHMPPHRRHVGMVFQGRVLWSHLTIRQHFQLISADRSDGTEVLGRLGLSDLHDRKPDEISGGEAQRLAVALALAAQPRLLLLDEPRGQIDPASLGHMDALLDEYLGRPNVITVLVSHDAEEVARWADEILVIDAAEVRQTGTYEQVYSSPASATVARQTGPVSLVPGTMQPDGQVLTALGPLPAADKAEPGARVQVVLRPEQLVPAPDGQISGVLTKVRFVRGQWLAEIECEATTVMAYVPNSAVPGAKLRLAPRAPVHTLPTQD